MRARLDAAKPSEVAGREVTEADQLDGWRFKFEGGWLLFRLSGTEPLLRIYTEVDDESCVEPVLAAGTRLAGY